MSDFLGRVGRITEWVVISNLENRAVNAACDKAQGWWKNRKHNQQDSHGSSASPVPPPQPSPSQSQTKYSTSPPPPQFQPQQVSYGPPPPAPFPPSMGCGELLISVNHIDGLNQWGPLIVIMECNHQRYQTPLGQYQQQFSFPVYQFDNDQLLIWIQTEYQQQTIAHGDIPIRILLNNNNNWTPQQQRWIPLRDYYNGPVGQLLVNIEYKINYPSTQQIPGPPPPYPYYS
ncbi:unnamed protein product [Rotaria sp. Silwood2]|nr:unnamed protein product [Rotaria sp. Silwood2]CAF2695122.1 unnamed protein product [Rotaria sp. Silwood2]CAF2944894.1 unnamed protein product [Rotaria sp. Silwood2]CAF3089368.1 unnamed protein product [Rotaria sp. Silwood2]CAF4320872.1 unnamed protein product [Rotaria sp. Silwood2]